MNEKEIIKLFREYWIIDIYIYQRAEFHKKSAVLLFRNIRLYKTFVMMIV
jgi:hypothetical protein